MPAQVPGSEWAAFRLGLPGTVAAVEVDTNHFKVINKSVSSKN